MLVIGFLDKTTKTDEGHRVRIPDYHKGHLGFVPKIAVKVAGPAESGVSSSTPERSCELIVTPYFINEHIVRINCTFDERKGVLRRLVNVVSHLGANIISLESASLFRSRYHSVQLVVNLVDSKLAERSLTQEEEVRYARLLQLVQTGDRRGMDVFFNIVRQCHDVLAWKLEPDGRLLPQVTISNFPRDTHTTDYELLSTTVERETRSTFIHLDKQKVSAIATYIAAPETSEFDYLLLSDTESRNLRIQFFNQKKREKLVQIGFYHKNFRGALDVITSIVADSGFNVLASLIRKVEDFHNVWEVILEYQGDEKVSFQGDYREVVKGLLSKAANAEREKAATYEISLFIPTHVRNDVTAVVGSGKRAKRKSIPKGWAHRVPLLTADQPPQLLPMTELLPPAMNAEAGKDWLLQYSGRALSKAPIAFISYSEKNGELRDALARRLQQRGWIVNQDHRKAAPMGLTHGEAKRAISDCDHFIGLWCPEDVEGKRVSPWMHFELGCAYAFNKPSRIIAHRDLSGPEIVQRIFAEQQAILFSDEREFKGEAVPRLLVYLDSFWTRPSQ